MRSRQQGITLIGFLIVASLTAFMVVLTMRMAPVYFEYMSVKEAMEKVADEPGAFNAPPSTIRNSLARYFDVSYVDTVKPSDIKLVRDRTGKWLVLDYEVRRPVAGNLYLVAVFKHKQQITGR